MQKNAEQEFLDSHDLPFNVEVINAGIGAHITKLEKKMIAEKIITYDPDLIIMYDGYNDIAQRITPEEFKNNWEEICKLGNEIGFDVIVTLQPINGFSHKVQTEQERMVSLIALDYDRVQWLNAKPIYDLVVCQQVLPTSAPAAVPLPYADQCRLSRPYRYRA